MLLAVGVLEGNLVGVDEELLLAGVLKDQVHGQKPFGDHIEAEDGLGLIRVGVGVGGYCQARPAGLGLIGRRLPDGRRPDGRRRAARNNQSQSHRRQQSPCWKSHDEVASTNAVSQQL